MPEMPESEPYFDVDRLGKLMELRGWKPGQLEYQSGVKYDTIYKIQSSTRPGTSGAIIAKLAKALGCSVDYLVRMTDDPTPRTTSPLGELTQKLLATISRLPPHRQNDLLIVAQALLQSDNGENDIRVNVALWKRIREVGGPEAEAWLLWLLGYSDDAPGDFPPLLPPTDEE